MFSSCWLLAAVVVLLSLPSFIDSGRCLTKYPEVNPKRYFHFEGQTLDIRLETSLRVSHQLTTHIFKIFLEEVLGYPYVSIVEQEDSFNISQIFEKLSESPGDNKGSVPPAAMVNLEVWFPIDVDTISWTDVYQVKDCGTAAPPGRFGWFIPRILSTVVQHMDHWRIFTKPTTASIFDLQESDMKRVLQFTYEINNTTSRRKFYCEESFCENGMFVPEWCRPSRSHPCAVVFANDPSSTGFLHQHILDLKLYAKVAWVGPNVRNITSALTNEYLDRKINRSLVIASWSPSEVIMYDDNAFTSVLFPSCDEFKSYNATGCKYGMQRLAKLAWAKLEDGAKPAYEAIHKVKFSRIDYRNLLKRYNQGKRTYFEIACEWMNTYEMFWKQWIPSSDDEKNILYIGGIFPISGSTYTAKGIVKAADLALAAVNANETILRDYSLRLKVDNGMCKADVVMKTFIDYILFNLYRQLVGILGPACSDTVEPLAGVTKHFKTVVISYSAEGSSFSDRAKYPYFFRTIGENKQYKFVYLQFLKRLGWERVASLTEDGQKYTEYISHMQDLLQSNGISFVINRKFPRERSKGGMIQYLEELKSKNARIIIGDMYDDAAREVMCEAYHLKMTAEHGYIWFLPLWLSHNWYDTDQYNGATENISCSTAQMIQAINGHMGLTHAYFAPDDNIMQENITVREWREKYKNVCAMKNVKESNYAGYAYDAVWTYALALNQLMKENQSYLSDLHSNVTTNRFVKILEATDFYGVSGRIQFRGGPSRVSVINVVQWLNHSTHVVGTFYPNLHESDDESEVNGGRLDLNESAIVWLTSDGSKPGDGREIPPECVLSGLSKLLNVTCEVAIVIANIIGFGLLGLCLLIALFVVKRRYDKKVQVIQNYKNIGIDLLSASNMSNLDKWEIPRDRVVINRKLGEGAFGTVYGGETYFDDKGWVAVAVKTLKVGSTTEEKLDFLSEAEVMKRFEHKNIVKLLGVCTKNEPVYTIMEFMLYGDLKTFLLARRHLVNEKVSEESDEISSKKLTMMALDVARALSYLAELKYVHRDVASRNCLVNVSKVVKLGDFGMTRPMFENDYYKFNRKGMLPVRWMAPESLALGVFTPASDVWSYGVLLYEIITFGSFPFQGLSNNQVLEHVKNGNILTIPAGVKPMLEGLMKSCWDLDHKKRPHASEIVEFLANNSRLLSPCLDVPLSSVQIENTGQMEIQLSENLRKCSVSPSGKFMGNGIRSRHRSLSGNSDVLLRSQSKDSERKPSLENGCVHEPLLGTPRSSSSSGMGLSKYVMMKRGNSSSDYTDPEIPETAVSIL